MGFIENLQEFLSPITRSVLNMVGKAVIKAVDDTQKLQLTKVLTNADELQDEVERIQQYGFTSHPKKNAEAIVLAVGGDPSNLIVIGTDDTRYRLKLAEGESALYNDKGIFIKMRSNEAIHFKSKSFDSNMEKFIDLFLSHKHLGNNGVDTSSVIASLSNPITNADFQTGKD